MIRQFPSSHFYENKLKDGKIVEDRVDPAFYRHCVLKPYIFFDVNQGCAPPCPPPPSLSAVAV
jgi:superfamily I DNA and/or RNA helicase